MYAGYSELGGWCVNNDTSGVLFDENQKNTFDFFVYILYELTDHMKARFG